MIIAIDGPAGSGKGTLARRLAAHYRVPHLDTGVLYRAVGLRVLRAGGDPASEDEAVAAARLVTAKELSDPQLRADETAQAASVVAAIPAVRDVLRDFQRKFASQEGGAVMDGRDIGTVIAPGANAKIFVTASIGVRARRRWSELRQLHPDLKLSEVEADMRRRDARDSGRTISPLRPADDALILDTDDLDPAAVFARALAHVDKSAGKTPDSPCEPDDRSV
ncbi:MAG: (d)CMP kinase [Pseudomonadota bacterium]